MTPTIPMRWFIVCLTLLTCQAQPAISPEMQLLDRIKARMAETLSHLPNYTCALTTQRSLRRPPARAFDLVDNVRLEVAVAGGREVYGWPGANRIDEAELGDLVGGTIGTGNFAILARSVFLSSGSTFTFAGETQRNGQRAARFDYRVPLQNSGYHLKVPPADAVVAYHGSFWSNPETLDLLRLEVFADDIPPKLGLAASNTSIDYKPARIGASEFVLPETSELLMTELHGTEHRNHTRFHDCRQYSGQSVLSFADPAPQEAAPAPKGDHQIELPDDFTAEFSLVASIDSQTSAVGDPVQVRLMRAIKFQGRVTAPKGALLNGRITRLQRTAPFYLLTITPMSLDSDEGHVVLSGRDNDVSPLMLERSARDRMLRTENGDTTPRKRLVKGSIVLETQHLLMEPGYRLVLRSRLLKSE